MTAVSPKYIIHYTKYASHSFLAISTGITVQKAEDARGARGLTFCIIQQAQTENPLSDAYDKSV